MNYKNQISDRVKILLIDEDESIFYLIRRVLQRENYRLTRFILQEVENREWR